MNSDAPHSVKYRKQSEALELTWADGSKSSISGQALRRYCACSVCRAKNQVGVDVITDRAQVSNIVPMGTSGIQVMFADGHDKGIYPWPYLRAIASNRAMELIN